MDCSADSLRDRDVRQREIVPREQLASCHALVIGVGAIGRQVALQLAAVGVPRMTLIDHDMVEVENLAAQGYWPTDLGNAKVHATKGLCLQINPNIELTTWPERFRRPMLRRLGVSDRLVVFDCVDSITTRRSIWEVIRHEVALYVDGRMSAEVLRVLAVDRPAMHTIYDATLFEADQAFAGSCTAKSTIYTASIAAGLLVGQFTKWLRGLPVDPDVCLNLLSMELTVPPATASERESNPS
jgi:sulfur carrier protein ThiS adenylyltransferase